MCGGWRGQCRGSNVSRYLIDHSGSSTFTTIVTMAENNNAPDIQVLPDGNGPPGQQPQQQAARPAGIMGTSVLGLSPFTWAILIGAGAMQYFSSSGEEPTTERKERTEQELLQEAAGMSPETLQQIRKQYYIYIYIYNNNNTRIYIY